MTEQPHENTTVTQTQFWLTLALSLAVAFGGGLWVGHLLFHPDHKREDAP